MINQKLIDKLQRNEKIKAVYLFGSLVNEKRKQGPLSDVEVCIFGKFNKDEKYKIMRDFSEKFDISFFDELPIYIKFRVFKEGEPLFIKDKKIIKIIKLLTLKEYLDFKHIIDKSIIRRFGNV